jgi:diguanylate cyclase (GGDEF)-like protein
LSKRANNVLKAATIIMPAIITLLLIYLLGRLELNPLLYKQLINTNLLLLNIVILLSWLFFQVAGSIIFVSIFTGLVLFVSAVSGDYYFNLHMIFYILLFLVCYYYDQAVKAYKGSRLAEIEDIEKEINILDDEYKQRQLQTKAYQKKFSKYAILKDITEKLGTTLSLAEVANLVSENSFNIIAKANVCIVFLIDEKKHKLVPVSVRKDPDAKGVKIEEPDYFDTRVLNKREPLLISDIRKDYRFDYEQLKLKIRNLKSLLATPLISKERSIGVIRLENTSPEMFDTEDLRILNIIADLSAVAVENAKLFEKTEELARRDSLTGCYVKRYMRELAGDLLKKAQDKEEKISFLMIDIDHFKKYNDEYGHIAGDIVLTEVSGEFKKISPRNAPVARYGGEEFAIILPKMNKKEALDLAEKIRQAIEEKVFYLRRKKTQVTISLGVATFTDDAGNLNELIERADKALYKAKETGRNKVCSS